MLYNMLDFPVGIVPVTKENESDQSQLQYYNYPDLACQLIKQVFRFFILNSLDEVNHLCSTFNIFYFHCRRLKEPLACH